MRYALEALLIASAATGGWMLAAPATKTHAGAATRAFGFCHSGGGTDCVVDGDTFWMDGTKIRVADIDAPETHPPRCDAAAAGAAQRRAGDA